MPRRGRVILAAVAAAALAGCGDDEPPAAEPQTTASGPDLRAAVDVRAGRDDLWEETARVAPGDTVGVRLSVSNTGRSQADGVRGGVLLPRGLEYVRGSAAEYRVAPPGTGAPLDGRSFVGGDYAIRPLPAAGETTYQLVARVRRGARGSLRVRGRVTGPGGGARDSATVRVRR